MLSKSQFIRESLELHLFFARIMKEHSFFLQVSFTPKNPDYIEYADSLRKGFDRLLTNVVTLSSGVVGADVLKSGEVITPFTIKAETISSYYTGVNIPVNLTKAEVELVNGTSTGSNTAIEQKVFMLNQTAMELTRTLIKFKMNILSNVTSCNMFTTNYPLLIEHVIREAKFYLHSIKKLQNNEETDLKREAYKQEAFWNDIMAEHSMFIRGLLDPSEDALINKANDFAKEFEELEKEAKKAKQAMDNAMPIAKITDDSINATEEISKFKAQGTQGIIECKIKSIILPLLSDHVLREANHYLRMLKMFKKGM